MAGTIRLFLSILILAALTAVAPPAKAQGSKTTVMPRIATVERIDDGDGTFKDVFFVAVRGIKAAANSIYQLQFTDPRDCPPSGGNQGVCAFRALAPEPGVTDLRFKIPASLAGAHAAAIVTVDTATSQITSSVDLTDKVILSAVSPRFPKVLALLVVAACCLLIGLLCHSTIQTGTQSDGRYVWAQRLLLDPDSNTFSLSKLQFYIWTIAAIGAYAFLVFSKTLLQGADTWIDLPDGLPVLFGYAAGTGVLSTAVTGAIGGKGTGDHSPAWSDLITSGGVVAPERVQFLIWTVLGAFWFLYFTLSRDPTAIQALPSIPDNFQSLMGISAAGYLGGKLARGPGPQIRSVTAVMNADNAVLTVTGSSLATKGAIFRLADLSAGASAPDVELVGTEIDKTSVVDPTGALASTLVLNIKSSPGLALTPAKPGTIRTFRFTIVNPDGEKAVRNFDA